ncbi:hypothetical protein AVANS_0091 [Campylobacter sp. RM5004]|uniref:hypothetical protein n=1 Tax=Campylobacter sp. RM5004 TaxID=1660078 RepID=UPI001EFAC6C7|nr:hypothetical protein [Campylobacter sp. RM5004]ULO00750.1 hypothetical protein AVANS_0091 [Campylobacter sp. RM5004]
MKYKLSLSLLTCLALSSGQLNAALIKPDTFCTSSATDCTINNNNNNPDGINITETSFKNITADNSKLWSGGKTNLDKLTLNNNSSLEEGGNVIIGELSSDGTAKVVHSRGTTNIKKITSTVSDASKIIDFESRDGYLDIGDSTSTAKNEIKNAFFHGNASVRFDNVKADNTIKVDLGYLSLKNSELNGTSITLKRDITIQNNNLTDVIIHAPTGLVGVAEGNTIINSKIDAKGTYTKNTFTNTEVGLNTTSEINLNENTFKGGKLKAQGKYTNNTFSKDDSGKGTDIDANISGYMHFVGKNTFDGVNMHRNTADQSKHNVVLDSNTETIFTNSTLNNISINGYGSGSANNKLTISGGALTNTTVGSHSTNTNISDLTLSGVTINNSGVANLNHNLRAQNITITNGTNATGAKINAQTKLDMTSSTLDATSAIKANVADIKTSNIGGATNVTNTLTSTSSTFGGTVNAKDLVSQKDTTSGTNSTFNGSVNITNSITASDTTFAKDVTANTITANNGSNFNANTTATSKITSNGATFGGTVTANELETLADNKSTFSGNVDIATSITANNADFKGNVSATNKITSTGATFEAEIKTAFLEANANSNFTATSNVNATDIKATGSTFSGNIVKNNSITADSSTFEKAIDTNTLTATNNSSFKGNVTVANKLTSNGAIFNGTVTANDLETLAGTISSSFASTVNVTNTLTSANAKFTNNVTAGTITANNGSSFGGITTANTITANSGSVFDTTSTVKANDNIIANAGSSFKGSTTATNKITSNGASFDGTINSAFLEANTGSTFAATSTVNATDIKATGSTFSGTITKNNSITADSSSFANAIDTNTLTASNGSKFNSSVKANNLETLVGTTASEFASTVDVIDTLTSANANFKGNVSAKEIIANDKAIFSGVVTASDTITANTGANFTSEVNSNILIANNGSVFDTASKVNVKDSIIANAGSSFKGSVATDFLAAEKGAEFIGTTDVRQLYANGSVFGGKVSINCEDPAVCGSVISGSTFSDLELKNNTQAIIDSGSKVANLTLSDNTMAKLDNNSNIGNLTLTNQANKVLIEGGSQITGTIENHGEIYVNNGTISSVITGTGDLFTNQVTYEKDVSLSDIRNSSNATYKGDTKVSNNAEVDNSTFNGMLNVDNKLTAYQGNKFNIVKANSADFLYDANKGASKDITANDINVTTGLVIDNINVTSNKISANIATIKNSANVSSLLTGASDAATKVYDANITKGNTYNVDNSTIKGGIRADKLNTSKSSIHGQVATNTLNATNTTFYIYGNGFGEDDSLYKGYSGAIIAREGAIGGGNRIQLANTNLSNLTQGFVPVAIIKQSTPTGGVVTAATTSSIGEDFFKVTYKSKLAMYELVDKYKHFSDINGSYVWSVGVSGEDLVNNTNIDSVISGADSTNIANGANNNYNLTSLEVEVGDMFKPTEFDKEAIDTAKFILTSPDYIIRTKNNTLSKRFRALKDYKLGNGFWLDNQMGYAKYEYNAIRYKNMSVGIDKTHEFNNSDLTLGLAASVGRAETKGNLSSDADSKGFGIYALNKFNNNVFIGANAFYHNIASSYEAKMLDVKANKSHNVYEASIESGVRFGDKVYFEPSLKYHLTSYKPTAINQEGLVLKGDSQLKHELGVALEGGFKVPNVFDAYLAVGLSKELNHKPDLIFIDELKIQNKVDGSKGDTSVGINFGVDYKLSPNASFNIDLGSNLYTNSDKELKGNIGFSYKF